MNQWEREPNHHEFKSHGFPCIMHRNHFGAWCGYVGVPETHPWYGKNESHDTFESVEVHGGVTYGDECQGEICHKPKEGESDKVWWVGFDCMHIGDYAPNHPDQFVGLSIMMGGLKKIYYRDMDFVSKQCAKLAEQAKAVG